MNDRVKNSIHNSIYIGLMISLKDKQT